MVNFGNTISNQSPFYLFHGAKKPFLGAPFTNMGDPEPDVSSATQRAGTAGTVNFSGIADGLSGTMLVGLGLVNVPRSMHPGGVDVGMADGAVRLIKNSVNEATFQALSSAGGSETVSTDSY